MKRTLFRLILAVCSGAALLSLYAIVSGREPWFGYFAFLISGGAAVVSVEALGARRG